MSKNYGKLVGDGSSKLTARDYDDLPWLHIYGQWSWHMPAEITGTIAGLTALRDAIDEAIKRGKGEAGAYVIDGEGYSITVQKTNRTGMEATRTPYTDEIASGRRKDKE